MATVIDTNVFVSALLRPNGTPWRAVVAAARRGTLIFTPETHAELFDVLGRPSLAANMSAAARGELILALTRAMSMVASVEKISRCRAPRDDKFLEAAVSGSASAIVTGDADLLVLGPFRGIAILTPRAFLEAIPG